MQPEPIGFAAAALIAQLGVLIILSVGAWVLGPFQHRRVAIHDLVWTIVILSIISLGVLILSDPVTETGRALFRDTPLPALTLNNALTIVFVADLAGTWNVVRRTGGTLGSPFAPVLALLPTLAIFLRKSFLFVLLYAAAICILMILELWRSRFLRRNDEDDRPVRNPGRFGLSHLLITAMVLFLTIVVGYATRPT